LFFSHHNNPDKDGQNTMLFYKALELEETELQILFHFCNCIKGRTTR